VLVINLAVHGIIITVIIIIIITVKTKGEDTRVTGRAVAQVATRWLPTAGTWVPARAA
jgi:hypothetical protein